MEKTRIVASIAITISALYFLYSSVAAAENLKVNDGGRNENFVVNDGRNVGMNSTSRNLKKDIREVILEDALQTVESLKPVTFIYKDGDQVKHVSFIAEDVPEMVSTPDRKSLDSMAIVAVLTKVIQEQQKTLKEQKEIMLQLQEKIILLEDALPSKGVKKGIWKKAR